jgi:hypothetical protein
VKKINYIKLASLICLTGTSACGQQSARMVPVHQIEVVAEENPVPGTVRKPWVEPMIDVVKTPGQLDPEGNYYLPEHEEVVEIRHDRFEEVQYGREVRTEHGQQ